MTGRLISHFEILDTVGKGGMGGLALDERISQGPLPIDDAVWGSRNRLPPDWWLPTARELFTAT